MLRSFKISISHLTQEKKKALQAYRRELLHAVNSYIPSLWIEKGKLDAKTLKRLNSGSLGYRQKTEALKFSLETVISTKKSAKALKVKASVPKVEGAIRLSINTCKVEKFRQEHFDYCVRISGMKKGSPIEVPIKSNRALNRWLKKPGAKLLQGCQLSNKYISLFVEVPDTPLKTKGDTLAIDLGYNKLCVDNKNRRYGIKIKELCQAVARKKQGSIAKRRAIKRRDDYIAKVIKNLPWDEIQVLGIEDLTNLKKNTSKKSYKKLRKQMAPWAYSQVVMRIRNKSEENRVHLLEVDPKNTSRICPLCGWESIKNRSKESFHCKQCGHKADADYVGSLNLLRRTQKRLQEEILKSQNSDGNSCFSQVEGLNNPVMVPGLQKKEK